MGEPTRIGLASLALLLGTLVGAQEGGVRHVLQAIVVEGDTIPVFELPEARIQARFVPKNRREAQQYDRLMRNVMKVYPYARVTRELLLEYEHDLSRIEREGDQDLYIKLAEAELRAEFEAELKDLTMSQGRVLVKLVDRETGRTSFDLVKELKGGFQAFMWQGMARLFGHDLKSTYDATGEDRMVEDIVLRIEHGELAVMPRSARTDRAQARLEKRKARLYRKYGLQQPGSTTMN
jgi:hypothetical protein